jgi:hypothetical protein
MSMGPARIKQQGRLRVPAEGSRPVEYVVAEYEMALTAEAHYDTFKWQSGGLLVAGAFVFLGLISAVNSALLSNLGAVIIAGVMSGWILYAQHYRALYLLKLHRVAELEIAMEAEANRRFQPQLRRPITYPRIGPRGHNIDLAMYLVVSAAAPALVIAQGMFNWLTVIAILVVLTIVVWVRAQEHGIKKWLAAHRTEVS